MIPKVIHYCWFGRGKMPELALKCIESWKKYLPDYEIKEWNEDNFDLNLYPYAREAYDNRKFAFVTDVVRLFALYHEGGIYMDTDVEVLKPLEFFLDLPAFSGFEDNSHIPTGIMASEKNGKWAKWQLSCYDNRKFVKADGTLDLTTNVITISTSMAKRGFCLQNSLQNFEDIITIYPKDFFCPKSYENGKLYLTKNTYTIHHFSGSWITPYRKFLFKLERAIGTSNIKRLVLIKSNLLKILHCK